MESVARHERDADISTPETPHRRLLRMAVPIIVSNATVPLLGAVDTAVVGQLPDPAYIGGVAVGAVLFGYVHAAFNFLRMGTTGPTAQAVGAARAGTAAELAGGLAPGGWGEVRNLLARALLLAAAIGLLIVALKGPLAELGLALMPGSAAVESAARAYLGIRMWSAPAALALFALIGWLYGLEDARVPLVLQLTGNGLNIGLDIWFVLGLGWGVEGVAVATVISEYTAVGLGIVLVRRRLRSLPAGAGRTRVLEWARIRRMMGVNRDIFIRTVCVVTALALFQAGGARLGDVTLAANQILFQLVSIATYAMDGFAHAAEALVGEAIGRARREAVRLANRAAHLWGGLSALALSLLWLAAGPAVIDLFTVVPEVRAVARQWLPWAAAAPLVSVWAFTFDGVFLGAVRNRTMRNSMLLAFGIYVGLLALLVPRWGNTGLWLALLAFFAVRGLTLWAAWPALLRQVAR